MKKPVATNCRHRCLSPVAVAAILLVLLPSGIRAHDMPSDVLVQLFVSPAPHEMQVLVRLPLISLLNINLPKRGEEYLDLGSIEPSLNDAAKATAAAIDFYEGDVKLTTPRIAAGRAGLTASRRWRAGTSSASSSRLP